MLLEALDEHFESIYKVATGVSWPMVISFQSMPPSFHDVLLPSVYKVFLYYFFFNDTANQGPTS